MPRSVSESDSSLICHPPATARATHVSTMPSVDRLEALSQYSTDKRKHPFGVFQSNSGFLS
jgi:hypothetical protein